MSLTLGRYHVSLGEIFTVFGNKLHLTSATVDDEIYTVILGVRLPRLIVAMLIGAGLSLSGGAYQGMFRNPLVSPDILGASAGAGFGAALGIMLSKSVLVTQFLALGFGLGAVLVTYFLAGRLRRGDPTLFLVLTGILVGTVFTVAHLHPQGARRPVREDAGHHLLAHGEPGLRQHQGPHHPVDPHGHRRRGCPGCALAPQPALVRRGRSAGHGHRDGKLRVVIIGGCTLMTASAVAVAGIIGWVGLIIPHVARGIVGPDYGRLLPVTAVIGAVYLLLIDDVARLAGPLELPIGILTSLIGAPFFLLLLARTRRAWS